MAVSKLGWGWEVRNDLPAKGEFFLDIPSFIERFVSQLHVVGYTRVSIAPQAFEQHRKRFARRSPTLFRIPK